jgi:hypothetical protein
MQNILKDKKECLIALEKFETMLKKVLNINNNYTEEDFIELEIINKYAINMLRQYNELLTKEMCVSFTPQYERLKEIRNNK